MYVESNLTDSTVESGLVFFLELSEDDAAPVLVVEGVVVVEAVAGLLAGFSIEMEYRKQKRQVFLKNWSNKEKTAWERHHAW